MMKKSNPSNKIFIIGAKIEDFNHIKGNTYGKDMTVISDISICIMSRYPTFDLHFRLLSILYSNYSIIL